MKSPIFTTWGVGLLGAAVSLAIASPAQAQAARVTAVQAVAEKRGAETPSWTKAPVGTDLRTGDRIRTGKRSKVDLKFGDGSLIRLGQLSTLEVQNDKQVQLSGGKLLFSFLRPGRILAGAGAAEIKGTVGIIALDDEGNATYSLYSGLLDVTTALRTIELRPGKFVTLRPNGTVLRSGDAAPLEYADGTRNPELLSAPSRGPYTGSTRQTRSRESTHQQSIDPIIDTVHIGQTQSNNPSRGGTDDGNVHEPLPVPFPTPGANPVPTPFPTLPPTDGGVGAIQVRSLGIRQLSSPSNQVKTVISRANSTILLAQAPPEVRETAPEATGVIPAGTAPSAEDHLGDADYSEGASFGSDARFIGTVADEGGWAVGGRLHAYATKGNWLFDGAVVPLRISTNTPGGRAYDNRTNVTDLSATYRAKSMQLEVGRLRFLEGPSQATLFGSMIRQGGREIVDGVRFTPRLTDKDKLEVAYLYDAFVRDLPYNVSGRQKGFFGRYQRQESFGNFGLNLLKYTNSDVDDTFGLTVDFSVPVIRNQLELYGEAGRDPFRRDLTSVGVYLPGLYQKTGLDVYLEWARLKDSSVATGAPNEFAVKVYKRINKYADALVTASHFQGGDNSLILGVSIGDPVPED